MVWVVGRWSSYLLASSFPSTVITLGLGGVTQGWEERFEMAGYLKPVLEMPIRDMQP